MNVLSLFDGMSCCQIALKRAGIEYDQYYASEIDQHTIKVTQDNFSNTIQLGDAIKWHEWGIDWSKIGLIAAGSPCQGFSLAGKGNAFSDARSRLFFVFVDIYFHIKKYNPSVMFLLENVKMKQEFLDIISGYLNVKPVKINSNKVSAQNRIRYYWTNWKFDQPNDKNIKLVDILESVEPVNNYYKYKEKSKCLRVGGIGSKLGDRHEWDSPYVLLTPLGFNKGGRRAIDGKVPCLTASRWEMNTHVFDKINKRRFTPVEAERLQTVSDNYTNIASKTQRFRMLGNGWTIDVIVHILQCGFKR